MPTSVSKTPLFTGSNPVRFSDLSSTFKDGSQKDIKFSDYKRVIDREDTNPVVPDATENEGISATDNNLKISGYRGSIKRYDLTQTGTNAALDLGSNAIWNGNLNRNIIKSAKIEGICHATSTANYGLKLEAETYNLDVDISGQIYGQGGTPGGPSSPAATGGSVQVTTSSTSYTRRAVYRYFNSTTGDHFCTSGSAPSGYISEGILCYVFTQQAPGTVGIYDNDDGDFSNAGRPYSGIIGYAYLTSQANTTRIYALTNGFDTMWSTATSEPGYSLLRTEFYAPTIDLTITSTSTTTIPGVPSTPVTPTTGSGDGGGALYIRNLTTRSAKASIINVSLNSTARVWAGGGSGRPGNPGFAGPLLYCWYNSNYSRSVSTGGGGSRGCPDWSCNSGGSASGCNPNDVRSRCRGASPRRGESGYVCAGNWTLNCSISSYYNAQGSGGSGGLGGPGRGWSNFNTTLVGTTGNSGNSASCSGGTSTGNSGNPGFAGGEWGEDSVGKKGPAITGNPSYYKIRGDSTTNFKGSIRNI